MQKSLMKLLGVAVLTWSSQAAAVGMGGINVSSALGQPLKANIELTAVSESEKDGLTARLASPEAYKAAGLDYPYGITFSFAIDENAKSVTISSTQAISAPFVSLLVELSWTSGKLLRDFTFLVDPVGYSPEQPKLPPAQVIAPVTQAAASGVAPIAPAEVNSQPLPVNEGAQVEPVKPVPTPVATVKVKRGDTLNKVATQNKPTEVSLDRMMVALYRVNANRFVGKNMNRVKVGTILRLPSQQELDKVSDGDAKKEIRIQARDWNTYRQQLANANASGSNESQQGAGQQSASGKISSTVTDKTPVSSDTANGTLKLSNGDAPTDKTISAQDKQNAKQEDAIAKAKAAQDEQARAALAAKNAADAKHLLDLKSQAAALASGVAASSVPMVNVNSGVLAASAPASSITQTASLVGAASTVKPVVRRPLKSVSKPVEPEKTFVDEALEMVNPVLDEPLYLAGGAAILLSLGGLAFVMNRRRKHPAPQTEHVSDMAEGFSDMPEEDDEVEDEGDDADETQTARFYQEQNAASYQPVVPEHEDEEDPIEEARLFLSFGRDAQAEDILKDALKKTPNNHQIYLELLGIYANRKDVNAFAAIAQQLKDSGDESVWKQAAAMGRKLDPNDTNYFTAEELSAATQQLQALVNAKIPDEGAVPVLDFDVGALTNKTSLPKKPANLPHDMMSLDMGSFAIPSSGLDVNVASATAENPTLFAADATGRGNIVFDVTAAHPSIAPNQAAPAKKSEPLSFNMDFTLPEMPAAAVSTPVVAKAPAIPAASPVVEMPFTIDFTMPKIAAVAPPPAATPVAMSGLDTIDFAISDFSPAAPAAAPAPSPMQGMDFAMMDLAAIAPIPPVVSDPLGIEMVSGSTSSPPLKLDFGDLNLNMDDSAPMSTATNMGEGTAWQEIANKLDLAKVYIEMDDAPTAREFLEEVLREGDAEQIATAQTLLKQIA